ncbi:MAG: N-acetyltransferase [Caldilineaceae bacterium]
MKIRYETVGDADGIHAVVTQAFARPAEADLVDALRAADAPRISLVADAAGRVVGHVLFTRVTVRRGEDGWSALALGPLAVLPSQQGHGVGSPLIRAGLDACLAAGQPVVFVVGAALLRPLRLCGGRAKGLIWDAGAVGGAWQVAELTPGALRGRTGIVSYRPEFLGV